MNQIEEVSINNSKGLYSKIWVKSIYKKNDEAIFVIQIIKKKANEEVPSKLETRFEFENKSDKNLKIKAFFLFPKDEKNIGKCEYDELKEAIKDAELLFGMNLDHPPKQQKIISANHLPWLNVTWLQRNVLSMKSMMWGASGLAAIFSLFAFRRYTTTTPEAAPQINPTIK